MPSERVRCTGFPHMAQGDVCATSALQPAVVSAGHDCDCLRTVHSCYRVSGTCHDIRPEMTYAGVMRCSRNLHRILSPRPNSTNYSSNILLSA